MSWIALKMLVGSQAKFYGTVLGLTFAALLICQQGSIFCGVMLLSCGQITDITGADLWVMDASVQHVDDIKPMGENNLYRVRGVDGVLWAVPLIKGLARLKADTVTPRGDRVTAIERVVLLGLDDATLLGAPPREKILVGDRARLRKPDAVMIDRYRLPRLYPGEKWDELAAQGAAFYKRFLGREMEMNDRRAIIVGVCETNRTFYSYPVVFTTYSRALQYAPQERRVLNFILAKTEPGVPPPVVAKRIQAQTGLVALSNEQFMRKTLLYYFKYTGIPINFGITAGLGFLVGTAIAGQTFYNFTLENLKQFGALKAMGATNFRIVKMILLQALVVGVLGYGIGVGLAVMSGWANQSPPSDLTYFIPRPVLSTVYSASLTATAGESTREAIREIIDRLFPRAVDAELVSRSCEPFIRGVSEVGAAPCVVLALMAVFLLLYAGRIVNWVSFMQALVVIGCGYLLAAGLALYYFGQGSINSELGFYTWWPIPLITGLAVVFICILTSLLSIRQVIVLEPAVVFRG